MSEDDHDVAGALLAELEAGHELVDVGGFSIDAIQARAKLREFQLADPHEYVLLLIEVAVLAGADPVRIDRSRASEITVSLGPLRIGRVELEQLFAAAFIDLTGVDEAELRRRRALQKLAFACNAALRLEPEAVEISVVGVESVRLRLTPEHEHGELQPLETTSEQPTVAVCVRHRGLARELREVELILDRCRFSSARIEVDGERVSVGHRFALHVEFDPGQRSFASNARKVEPVELDGRRIGCAGVRYSDSATAEVWILTNGVLAEQRELGDSQRVAAANFGAVVELDLPKDLGQTKLAHGPEYERVIAAIWEVHDRIAPNPTAGLQRVQPPGGLSLARAFSIDGLYVIGMVIGVVMLVLGSTLIGATLLFGGFMLLWLHESR